MHSPNSVKARIMCELVPDSLLRLWNTAENENEEVDGSCICGLKSKRGVRVTEKQISPAGCANTDTYPANSPDSLSHQRMLGHLEPRAGEFLQKPPGFPVMQEAGNSTPKDCQTEEVPPEGTEEMHRYEDPCATSPENYGRMDSSSKDDQALRANSDSKEKQLVLLDTTKSGEQSGASTNNEEKPCAAEDGWRSSCAAEQKTQVDSLTAQEKDSQDSFTLGSGISKETLQELKSLLRGSPLLSTKARNSSKPSGTSSHTFLLKSSNTQSRCVETFHPHLRGGDQKTPSVHQHGGGQVGKPQLVHSSAGLDKQQSKSEDTEHPFVRQRTSSPNAGSSPGIKLDPTPEEHSRDPGEKNPGGHIPLRLLTEIECIKEQMSRDNVHFVRFEATDLHGVSRSKSIPSRFFRANAIHGVSMPRGYLELTLNPKDNEINQISASNFNCDIILSPDLSTFRVLPWTEQTARVICDSFTVTGNPLLTSPRHIAKRQLSQLQDNGFALSSAFTYEFCIYSVAEIVNSKTISFPAATILNNHDQPFIQELIDGMYHAGANIESFSSSTGPGQMEVSFHPEFGIGAADSAFTFRTGIKEVAKKYNYIVSFFTEDGFCNSGILSHSLWDSSGQNNLFSSASGPSEFTDIGKNWLAGLLVHSAALSCLMAPTVGCRKRFSAYSKDSKEAVNAKWAWNDNSCAFNIKSHGEKGTRIENKLGSATANPYLVLSAMIAAGLDGIKRGLSFQEASEDIQNTAHFKAATIPLKLEDALVALQEDECIREALGDTFVRYFVAMKQYELETEEMDVERNKFLEYFI
ncbi:lengsin [Hemicordylus capensis]|uniref:lengsin n=1 Tax=Hemicordylus capensis TaxID=884348 RepID=UPI002302452D|nr:lengsin [Hemicordylus capensis]